MSSAKNKYKFTAFLFEDVDGGGQFFCIFSGGKVRNFANFADPFDDVASSSQLPDMENVCI